MEKVTVREKTIKHISKSAGQKSSKIPIYGILLKNVSRKPNKEKMAKHKEKYIK